MDSFPFTSVAPSGIAVHSTVPFYESPWWEKHIVTLLAWSYWQWVSKILSVHWGWVRGQETKPDHTEVITCGPRRSSMTCTQSSRGGVLTSNHYSDNHPGT